MRTRLVIMSAFVAFGIVAIACGGKKPPPKEPNITEVVSDAGADAADAEPPKPKTLSERLGGREGIAKLVDAFTKNVAADTKINKRFAKVTGPRLEKFKQNLTDQLCKLAEGDCQYNGKNMKDAHKGMKLTDADWNAFLLDLKAALDENKVGESEQGELVALLAPMRDDIVEVKPKPEKTDKAAPKK